jgi:hypothetical protein
MPSTIKTFMQRRVFVSLVFCLCSLAKHGQKTRYGKDLPLARPGVDYPIKVHFSAIRYRSEFAGEGLVDGILYVDTVISGKKVELRGSWGISSKSYGLTLADYQARLVKDPHQTGNAPMFQEYEVILPNKTVWRCAVTGISE